jgi:hypothetical protein
VQTEYGGEVETGDEEEVHTGYMGRRCRLETGGGGTYWIQGKEVQTGYRGRDIYWIQGEEMQTGEEEEVQTGDRWRRYRLETWDKRRRLKTEEKVRTGERVKKCSLVTAKGDAE